MRRPVLALLAVCVALAGGGVAVARGLPLASLGSAMVRVGSGASPASQQYRPPAPGVERVPIVCQAEWNPHNGLTSLYLFAPDTPQVPFGPSGLDPWTGANGTGLFTPSGRMLIVCTGHGTNPGGGQRFTLPFAAETSCTLFRGGEDFSTIGARVYRGRGKLAISTSSDVVITCRGSFAGISTGPGTPPTPPSG